MSDIFYNTTFLDRCRSPVERTRRCRTRDGGYIVYIPHSQDRIKVAGREGLFIVMSVDYARERVNIRSLSRVSAVTMHVPFWELLPVD